MSRNAKTMLAGAAVAFALSIGVNVGIGPSAAWAQTATKLNCKKCVSGKAVKKGAIKFNRLKGKVQDRIIALENATKALEGAAAERVPFYVVLDGDGAEETIATNGALEFFARCRVNDGGQDRIQIFVTSSVDGWFEEDTTGPQTAGTEILMFQENQATGTTGFDNDIDEGSAAAPDGSYVAMDGEMLGLGVNIFGHDCIAIGNAMLFTGTL